MNIKFIDVNGVNIREEQRNDDSSLLFESLHSDNALSEDQIREILGRHSTNEIRLWSRLGHPLFHEAGHQSGEGARIVWKIVLENPEFRKLVVDPTYKDKYGKTALQRLREQTFRHCRCFEWKSKVLEESKTW